MMAIVLVPLLALGLAAPAAATPTTLLLVVDASPSMAGEVATSPAGVGWWRTLLVHAYGLDPDPPAARDKLAVVRAALGRYVAHLPAETAVGVRVFGQQRWQGCEDSQLLIAPTSAARSHLAAVLARLQPSVAGKTALAHGLKEAVRDFLTLPSGGAHHIILITDATDRCTDTLPEGDVLTGETGVSATIDVITLGLDPATAAPLEVATLGTGGHLYPATDATTVEIALRRCLPVTPRQHIAAALRLHPGGWPMAVAAVVLLLLAVIAWLEVRSER